MGYKEGFHRQQMSLFPEALDDYISADNPVRFLDAFVEQLDLQSLDFQHAIPAETGRPAYNPGDMLRLFVYGYLNRVRSSRLLEREVQRNLELMWLMKKLAPDFKTIADFRKDNTEAIRRVCREFTLFCREAGLFGGDLVAIDGSKFKAVNARDKNYSRSKLQSKVREIDGKISQYLDEIGANDRREKDLPRASAEELKEKIQRLKEKKRNLNKLSRSMASSAASQISLSDPDSRSMPVGKGHGTDVGYNVQLSVDSKNKLILDHEVTNDPTDHGHLSQMALRAKKILGEDHFAVVADKGYYDGKEVAACVHEGIDPHIAKPLTSANKKLGLFTKEDFRYDEVRDCYLCPAKKILNYRFQENLLGRETRYYMSSACVQCRIRLQCTRSAEGRRITRSVHEGFLDMMARRIKSHPEKLKSRQGLVEHPFGTIKRSMNQGYFLTKSLKKVRTEMSLTVLAYNLKRVFNILGTRKMIEGLA